MKRKTILTLFICVLLAVQSFALVATPKHGPVYYGIRHNGMGNTSVAVVDDRYALFNNPAGLAMFDEHIEISLCPLLLNLDQKFFNIAGFLLENESKLDKPNNYDTEFFNEFSEIDGQWAMLGYLPEATVTTRRFAFGTYNVLSTRVSAETGHFIPKLGLGGNNDFVMTAGYAHPIKKQYAVGLTFKYIYRLVLNDTILGFTNTLKAAEELQNGISGGMTGFSEWAHLERGFGFDLGGMAKFNNTTVGLAMQDIFEYLDGEFKQVRVSLGAAHHFGKVEKLPMVDELLIAMDIKDLFREDNFFNKIHLGAEADFHVAALRLGINQGYPVFGFGLNFFLMHFDYAFLTEELGYYPGQKPITSHLVSLRLGLTF